MVYGLSRGGSPIGGAPSSVEELDWQDHQKPIEIGGLPIPPSIKETKIQQLHGEIAQMKKQLQDTDQELRHAGFPDILLDERLTESERNRILDKVKLSTEIQTKLSRLQILKIDIEHSAEYL